MKKLPDGKKPEDIEAWQQEIDGIIPLKRPDEKPSAPLIIGDIIPSPKLDGLYNGNSFKFLSIGDISNLDKNTASKFVKGQFKIEAQLDLHGFSEKEAFTEVINFISDSYAKKRRCVLIITGKGIRNETDAWYESKGVIKEALPVWLNNSDIRPFILSISYAQQADGGEGAVYVLLKRQRL